uniref:Nucleoporin 37 n=1 Tax=Maylandia zebra TaxID=106582 RepID=A0A3P9DHN3_9CICH
MQEDSSHSPSYTVPCDDFVHVVEFSPFSSGTPASLLAYGGNQYVVVGTCLFQEEDVEVEGVEFNVLRAFHHELRVDALAWSPESRLDRIPTIRLCTAAADRKLRLLTSDLQDRHEVKVMEGHTSYINHLVFEPMEGKQIASVSDDHTCRVWDLDGNESATFRLQSPGISVCWHPKEVFKVGVAYSKAEVKHLSSIDGLQLEGQKSALFAQKQTPGCPAQVDLKASEIKRLNDWAALVRKNRLFHRLGATTEKVLSPLPLSLEVVTSKNNWFLDLSALVGV